MQWTLRNAVPTCDLCDDQRSVLCPLTSVAHLASTCVSVAVYVVSCMSAMLRYVLRSAVQVMCVS